MLRAPDGRLLARCRADLDGRTLEVLPVEGAPPDEVAHHLLAERPSGSRIGTSDAGLADALTGAGAAVRRRATELVRPATPVADPVQAPDGWHLSPLVGVAGSTLLTVQRLAYPPEHVDFDGGRWLNPADTRTLLDGRTYGALLPRAGAVLRDASGRACGHVVTVRLPGPPSRPYILDLAVVPAASGRGLGRLLLQHALTGCLDSGQGAVGLTVTDGNPARRLYDAAGFRPVAAAITLVLP